MTNKERHIEVLNRMLESMDVYDSIQPTTERKKAIKAAIKALEQEPCEDAISRQAALNSLINNTHLDGYDLAEALDAIENKEKLPSVTPQQKYGKWIAVYQGDEIINYRCSECELGDTNGSINLYGWDYCRRCGSYNGGDNNGNE